jgi:putative transposase
MPQSLSLVFVHYVWATWHRAPLIGSKLRSPLYGCISNKCSELKCELIAIGGVEDHVHVLVRMHADISVGELAKGMKGASSHLITHQIAPEEGFKWQGGYGALSVSRNHVTRIVRYIARQEEHHASGKQWLDFEKMDFDEPVERVS